MALKHLTRGKFYTPEEAAELLQLSVSYVRELCREGIIVAYNMSKEKNWGRRDCRKHWRIPEKSIDDYLQKCCTMKNIEVEEQTVCG